VYIGAFATTFSFDPIDAKITTNTKINIITAMIIKRDIL
jgi:hypothetical protein